MANLKDVIYLSNIDYYTLATTGTVTINGETLTYDENNLYITPDNVATPTEDGLMSSGDKTKLNGIAAGAEVNVQSDWGITDSNNDAFIKNKPSLAVVATSGSYNDLSNKPTIDNNNQKVKAGTVTFGANDTVNFEGSGIVSVTGDAINDKITISASHQSIKTLKTDNTAAQSTSASETITGSGTINLHKIAKTGNYSDLNGAPTIPTITYGTLAYYFRPYTAQALYRYKFVMLDKDNRLVPLTTTNVASGSSITSNQTPTALSFRPDKIYWYNTTTTINAGAVIGENTLMDIGYNANNSTNGGMARCNFNEEVPAYRMIYLCGTYNATTGLFSLRDGGTASSKNYYEFVPTNTANLTLSSYFTNGYDYILLGGTYSSAAQIHLRDDHPMYHFDGTNLVPYDTWYTRHYVQSLLYAGSYN